MMVNISLKQNIFVINGPKWNSLGIFKLYLNILSHFGTICHNYTCAKPLHSSFERLFSQPKKKKVLRDWLQNPTCKFRKPNYKIKSKKNTQKIDWYSTAESCAWLCKIGFECVKDISWGVYIFNILEIELLVLSWIFICGFYVSRIFVQLEYCWLM